MGRSGRRWAVGGEVRGGGGPVMADRWANGTNAVALAGALGAIIAGLVVPIVGVAIGVADPVAIMGGVTEGDGVTAVVGGGGGKVAELKGVGGGGAGPGMGRGTEATGLTRSLIHM